MRRKLSDLIIEAQEEGGPLPQHHGPGVEVEETSHGGVTITQVRVTTQEAAQRLGKPMGRYVTVEAPMLRQAAGDYFSLLCTLLSQVIGQFWKEVDGATLVVGLGNGQITPDSIGPKTIENTLVTRHLVEQMPEQFAGQMESVCAFCPGVLGVTGMESGDMLRGVIRQIKPRRLLAIDALCAQRVSRLGTTFQFCDSGIHPGSGVHNRRMELSEKTLGIPVLAVGVPTVVDGATLTCDLLEKVQTLLGDDIPALGGLDMERHYSQLAQALGTLEANLMVTPKEVDDLTDQCGKLLGTSISLALQPTMELEDILHLMS
jgi:spore protease